ncbi:tetratricopeptide repeat protein, partial [Kitasatospora sp. NPDC007106]|uniref:tetratricopeptide repeat protein n=1 Tax=Kitasatospora sp. NPDC007106 TaxID=3156914 RepID=UPI0033C83413
ATIARHGLARTYPGGLQLHRLTREVLRNQLTTQQHQQAARAAEALLTAATPQKANDPSTWHAWTNLVPHALALPPENFTTSQGRFLACEACWYLMDRGNPTTALPRLKALHDTWTRQLGPDDEEALWAANYLARAYSDTQDYAGARALDEDTLERRRRILGDDHPDTLTSANNLAIRLADLGDTPAAHDLTQDTYKRRRRILGDDHPDTLGTAHNLAVRLADLGDTPAAHDLTQDTYKRRRRILGDDHPDTLDSAHSLANRLADLGDTPAAHDLTQDTYKRRRRILGDDHPDTLGSAQLAHHLAGGKGGTGGS